jgi:hypothetical protein
MMLQETTSSTTNAAAIPGPIPAPLSDGIFDYEIADTNTQTSASNVNAAIPVYEPVYNMQTPSTTSAYINKDLFVNQSKSPGASERMGWKPPITARDTRQDHSRSKQQGSPLYQDIYPNDNPANYAHLDELTRRTNDSPKTATLDNTTDENEYQALQPNERSHYQSLA